MENSALFRTVSGILGKKESSVQELKNELRTAHTNISEGPHVRSYQFPELGFELIFSKKRECFFALAFFIDTPSVQSQTMQPYKASFFDDIEPYDSIQAIANKLTCKSVVSKHPEDTIICCDLPEGTVKFFFDESGKQMRLVLLKLARRQAEKAD